MYLLCLLLLLLTAISPIPHPPISLPLASLLSPLVVRLSILVNQGESSLASHHALAQEGGDGSTGRSLICSPGTKYCWAHIHHPHPTGLGSEGPLPSTVPMGSWPGGIYLKVTRYLEGKNFQVRTTVFSNDAFLLRCTTRLRLALMHQEYYRSQGHLRAVPPQP